MNNFLRTGLLFTGIAGGIWLHKFYVIASMDFHPDTFYSWGNLGIDLMLYLIIGMLTGIILTKIYPLLVKRKT